MVKRCLAAHDFKEGVRALLIDKDQCPRWHPASLRDVDKKSIEEYFAPLIGADELDL